MNTVILQSRILNTLKEELCLILFEAGRSYQVVMKLDRRKRGKTNFKSNKRATFSLEFHYCAVQLSCRKEFCGRRSRDINLSADSSFSRPIQTHNLIQFEQGT